MRVNIKFLCCGAIAMAFCLSGTASAADYTIQIKKSLTGDDVANHQFEFELRDASTNELIQTKKSNQETITFDTISKTIPDNNIGFYKVIEKDLGENGMTYDRQVAYIGLYPNGKVAYQKDNTYKYLSKDGQPHPYHATDEELQGEAYAVLDIETGILTFFRDEAGKYTNKQIIGNKIYFANFEKPASDIFKSGTYIDINNDRIYLQEVVKEVIFKDAVRPEGKLNGWFEHYEELTKADINKLDTSRVTGLNNFLAYTKKLEDVDITKLDFSSLSGGWSLQGFLAYSNGIKEFDSRNYDFSTTADLYVTGEFLTGDYYATDDFGLRYVNLEKMVSKGSSGELSGQPCIEKIVLGKHHSLYGGGTHFNDGMPWLNINTGEILPADEYGEAPGRFREYLPERMAEAAGTYVKPTCNTDPVTFENSYVKPADSEEEPKNITPSNKDNTKNPNTATSIPAIYFALFGALSIAVALVVRKTVKDSWTK